MRTKSDFLDPITKQVTSGFGTWDMIDRPKAEIAMQEYLDQGLAEYKAKLKEKDHEIEVLNAGANHWMKQALIKSAQLADNMTHISKLEQSNRELLEALKVALQYMHVFVLRNEEPLVGERLTTDYIQVTLAIEGTTKKE
jgi:hypothetical protein